MSQGTHPARRRSTARAAYRGRVNRRAAATILAGITVLAVPACGGDDERSTPTATDDAPAATTGDTSATTAPRTQASQRFPDVVGVEASFDDVNGTWTFAVTISSPYDTPERYADGWRVVGPDGAVFGVHTLAHDHANEQPFTRRQTGVTIPDGVAEVTIEGRDQANGFGGGTMTISLQTG